MDETMMMRSTGDATESLTSSIVVRGAITTTDSYSNSLFAPQQPHKGDRRDISQYYNVCYGWFVCSVCRE